MNLKITLRQRSEMQQYFIELEKFFKSPVILYWGYIGADLVECAVKLLNSYKISNHNKVTILFNSIGGDFNSLSRLLTELKEFQFDCFVLEEAKSCGTMLALSANNLYLDPNKSKLGLIDEQMENPINKKMYPSVNMLDYLKIKYKFNSTNEFGKIFECDQSDIDKMPQDHDKISWVRSFIESTNSDINLICKGLINGCLKGINNKENIAKQIACFLSDPKSIPILLGSSHAQDISISLLKDKFGFEYLDYTNENTIPALIKSYISNIESIISLLVYHDKIRGIVQDKNQTYY